MIWKRSKLDGCQLYTNEEHGMEIWEMYESVPDGRYQLSQGGMVRGTGSLGDLKELAQLLVNFS